MSAVYNTRFALNRAHLCDEPFVTKALRTQWGGTGIQFAEGTEVQDWEHIDIISTNINNPDYKIEYDVKRNHSSQWDSPNFLFTFRNHSGKDFPFKANGYFAYIDDVDGSIAIISHMKMQEFVNTHKHYTSKFKQQLSQYILINKTELKQAAFTVIAGSETKRSYLERNRDEQLYDF